MATYLFWTGAGGTPSGGPTWADAYTAWSQVPSLTNGDIVKVHTGSTSVSAESFSASQTLAGPVSGVPAYIIGVDKDSDDTVVHESASDNFYIPSGNFNLLLDGSLCVIGVHFSSSYRIYLSSGDNNEVCYLEKSRFAVSGSQFIQVTYPGSRFKECTFAMGTASYLSITGNSEFVASTFSGSTTAYQLKIDGGPANFVGCDLSSCTGSEFVQTVGARANFIGCNMPSSYTLNSNNYGRIYIYGSSNSTANNQWINEIKNGKGGAISLVTSYYRSGGSTYDGTTGYSYKLSSNTDNDFAYPVTTDWNTGYIPADSGTQTTFTAYIANTTADLDNSQVWLEVEYYGTSGTTQKTIATNRVESPLVASPTSHTDDTDSTWASSPTYMQKMSLAPVTVQKSGMYRWRVCANYSTTDIYVCAKIDAVQA